MSYRQTPGGNLGAQPRVATGPSRGSAGSGAVKRRKPLSGGASSGSAKGNNMGGILRWSTDDAPGLKIGPTVVLVTSLLFIAFVIVLHIWGKLTR
eukprot:TRINITY_DN22960_c0_g1_i1.p1 TRINITY_DN22960_c0_g1~~TRINITY_DN22960_c0_g1_i1.p1  ORF type:complete len:95 (+),score=26.04 TRINITY_DN22960_c0_g1_i1:37-321(+)